MQRNSRRPSIKQIAYAADVSTATVDRVLNNRPGVREKTRKKIEDAIKSLRGGESDGSPEDITGLRMGFILNTTELLTDAYQDLIPRFAESAGLRFAPKIRSFSADRHVEAANEFLSFSKGLDGVVLVARSSATFVNQINAVAETGTEVVCVTTDFPGSQRLCYVGMDQVMVGRLAARLVAMQARGKDTLVALHIGHNWRCEGEREMGFRTTLRDLNFQGRIVELYTSSGTNDEARTLLKDLRQREPHIDMVYSPSSGVIGLADAIADQEPQNRTFIIGHEVFDPLKDLLQQGLVGAQIATNNYDILTTGLQMIARQHANKAVPSSVFLPAHIVLRENVTGLDWY